MRAASFREESEHPGRCFATATPADPTASITFNFRIALEARTQCQKRTIERLERVIEQAIAIVQPCIGANGTHSLGCGAVAKLYCLLRSRQD